MRLTRGFWRQLGERLFSHYFGHGSRARRAGALANAVIDVLEPRLLMSVFQITGSPDVTDGHTFHLSLTTDSSSVEAWAINWNDGSSLQSLTGGSQDVDHLYSDLGDHTITATATDSDGAHILSLIPANASLGAFASTPGDYSIAIDVGATGGLQVTDTDASSMTTGAALTWARSQMPADGSWNGLEFVVQVDVPDSGSGARQFVLSMASSSSGGGGGGSYSMGSHGHSMDSFDDLDNPLGDPGFEDYTLSGSGWYQYEFTPSDGSWDFIGGAGIAAVGSGFGPADGVDGNQFAMLQQYFSDDPAAIEQTVDLDAGYYSIDFLAAQRVWADTLNAQIVQVSVDDTVIGTFTPDSSTFEPLATDSVYLDSGSHTIRFDAIAGTAGDNTAFLDDIAVVSSDSSLSAPSSFTASSGGSSSINLSWGGDSSGSVYYVLDRYGPDGFESESTIDAGDGHDDGEGSYNYTDTGLTPGTSYTYNLQAEDDDSDFSDTVSASATTDLPPIWIGGGSTIFYDNFDSGASSLWGNEVGSWSASGGAYGATSPSSDPLATSTLPFDLTDFSLDVDVNQVGDGGIWLRSSSNGQNGVLLVIGGGGWGAGETAYPAGTSLYFLTVQDGEMSGPSGEIDGVFSDPGVQDTHIHVDVSGDVYTVYAEGQTTSMTTDLFSDGRVGLYDNSSAQTFDNFQLTSSTLQEGSTYTLSATPGDIAGATYQWDLDGDSIFGETGTDAANGDETGPTVDFTTAGLTPGAHTVSLQVTTDSGESDVEKNFTVQYVPPAVSWVGTGSAYVTCVAANGTFLRADDTDSITSATVIDLSSLPFTVNPGDILHLQQRGAFAPGSGWPDTTTAVEAVFSSSNILLSNDQLLRVPGAIPTDQPGFDSGDTYFGGQETDIDEDFSFSGDLYVRVPEGAPNIFLLARRTAITPTTMIPIATWQSRFCRRCPR